MNILFTELPYSAALHVDYLRKRCSNCFSTAHSKCSKCQISVYCNRDCQASDWTYHKVECTGLKNGALMKISSPPMDVAVRLLTRILIRFEMDHGDVDQTTDFPKTAKLRQLSHLMSHSEQFDKSPKDEYFQHFKICFIDFYGLAELWRRHSEENIKEILGKCQTNVFDITEDTLDGFLWLGSGIYLNASRFDHSCDPDIHWSFDGCKINANLLKPESSSKPLDSLTVNYGFSVQSYSVGGIFLTAERQKHLIGQYHFVCKCNLCTDKTLDMKKNFSLKWSCHTCKIPYCFVGDDKKQISCLECPNILTDCPMDPGSIVGQLEMAKKHLREAHRSDDGRIKNTEVAKAMKILQNFAHPIHNIWFCRANLELFMSATENLVNIPYALLPDTIFIGEKVLKTHEIYAPFYDLTLSDIARRLSKLYQKMNNFKRAKEMLIKVRKSWEYKCGSNHACFKAIDNELDSLDLQ